VRKSLQTSDLREAATKVASMNKSLEAKWNKQRLKPLAFEGVSVRKQAMSLLDDWGLSTNPEANNEDAVRLFYDMLETSESKDRPSAHSHLVRSEAAKLLAGVSELRLNDVLDECLAIHPKRGVPKFVSDTRRAFGKLIKTVGDKPISELVRTDAHKFVADLQAEGSATGTIRRYVNVCQAIVGLYFRENDVQRVNPLSKVVIANEGQDADEREPYSNADLAKLCSACASLDDDIRWITAMIADTGARLAEIVGLSLEDIVLNHETPHIVIRRHPWRSLKTDASAREVPLLRYALWAAQRVLERANEGQVHAFPRYIKDGTTTKATSASNTLVKWIGSLGIEHNVHELRHTMVDRLRAVMCPEDIRLAIGGWARDGVGEKYGKGHALKMKADWLAKAVNT
jgi:integrase